MPNRLMLSRIGSAVFVHTNGEPAFDLIEPRGGGRREMHVEARISREPPFDGRSFMGTVVVHNQMHVEGLGTASSIVRGNCKNSFERCRRCSSPIILPVAMLGTANSSEWPRAASPAGSWQSLDRPPHRRWCAARRGAVHQAGHRAERRESGRDTCPRSAV
jgi:hypothetical protein